MELKPCPFCSGEKYTRNQSRDDAGYFYWVECEKCAATGPELYAPNSHIGIEAAIEAWNTRIADNTSEKK